MKQPDRFAREVGKHRHIARDGMGYILLEETARHLLRVQHNAYVRLVKRLQKPFLATPDPRLFALRAARVDMCAEILAAMARYRKGKP